MEQIEWKGSRTPHQSRFFPYYESSASRQKGFSRVVFYGAEQMGFQFIRTHRQGSRSGKIDCHHETTEGGSVCRMEVNIGCYSLLQQE